VRSGIFYFSFAVLWLTCLENFVLYSNCFLIVISALPSFRANDVLITFSIQLLTVTALPALTFN
jgi:hypothetical protein